MKKKGTINKNGFKKGHRRQLNRGEERATEKLTLYFFDVREKTNNTKE